MDLFIFDPLLVILQTALLFGLGFMIGYIRGRRTRNQQKRQE